MTTNKEKATKILAIILEELNMPANSTLGDVALALSAIDENNEILGMLKHILRDAVIDEIKQKIA